MIERRKFLSVLGSGIVAGSVGVAVIPNGAGAATAPRDRRWHAAAWKPLVGSSVVATDRHGHRFPLSITSVTKAPSDAHSTGEAFTVRLRSRSRVLTDGTYRLAHRDLGGDADMFLVGGGAKTATLIDTRRRSARA